MRPEFRKMLEELYEKYSIGPSESDCDGDFDFGFSSGMALAYEDVASDLAVLLGKFYSDWKPKRRRRRK